ncbi:phycobilisome protein [Lusitaniella coriacea LEGE 07157]|uniref:Phycobilisome protein n=1 Tax=Lusitaniella coriacea LEGE 07157 TaxID=945747 RepID=A0A8J7DV93_9CYAN|nr:phycobilisome protein [Lusitaniella coriacea]MBE9115641.1 phycobilisome protein [Lusitaniella coriacea LEGE 07157]
MSSQLSDRAKQLIAKARIVSFTSWTRSHPNEVIQIFQDADNEGRYLRDRDLAQIQTLSSSPLPWIEVVKTLRDRAPEIVDTAREQVLAQYPAIAQPGGDLYPPIRAESCWRDFWHFLRCITYGIAGNNPQYLSQDGLKNMELLYQELRVPLKAMILGLENLKTASLKHITPKAEIAPYFDSLIRELRQFQSQ